MAERSFAREVQDLKLGDGEEFRGEGILAITKALLQSGVSLCRRLSGRADLASDGRAGRRQGRRSTSSACISRTRPRKPRPPRRSRRRSCIRSAAPSPSSRPSAPTSPPMPIANLASGGVTGGALIIIGEDYGEGSSIMQERSHAFAMKSQIWLLDPRPNLQSIVKAVEEGFELSEASQHAGDAGSAHPRLSRPRPLHRQGQQAAGVHAARGAGEPRARHQPHRAAAGLLHARAREDRAALARGREVHQGAQAQRDFSARRPPRSASSCRAACTIGVCASLQQLGLADVYGETAVPIYVPQRHLSADRRRSRRFLPPARRRC